MAVSVDNSVGVPLLCWEPQEQTEIERVRSIIVVGPTGAGKSKTIKQVGGKHVVTGKPPEISQAMESCTQDAAIYDMGQVDGARYHLVDTMGMLDTNKKDREGLESIAHLMDHLSTVVGVIYVTTGRMTPAEVDTCNFLFGEFFHDLHPSRLLVLRTHVEEWESYNAKVDKDYLKRQNGVPKRFLDANFVAVDFHPLWGQDALKKMTGRILQNMESWTTPIQLSNKSDIVVKYYTVKKALLLVEQAEKELEVEKKNSTMKDDRRRMLLEFGDALTQEKQKLQSEEEKLRSDHPNLTKECDKSHTFNSKVDECGEYVKTGAVAGAVGGIMGGAVLGAAASTGGVAAGAAAGAVAAVAALPLFALGGALVGLWSWGRRKKKSS